MLLKPIAPLLGVGLVAALPGQPKLFRGETQKLNQALQENEKAIEEIEAFDGAIQAFFNAPEVGFLEVAIQLLIGENLEDVLWGGRHE